MDPNQNPPTAPASPEVPISQNTQQNTNATEPPQQTFGNTIQPITPDFTSPQPLSITNSVVNHPISSKPVQPPIVQPNVTAAAVKPKKTLFKLIIKIIVLIAIIVGLGFGTWQLFLKDIGMKQYSFDKFSVSIPETYKVLDSSGNNKTMDIKDVSKDVSVIYFRKAIGNGSNDKNNVTVMISVGTPLGGSRSAAEGILNGLFIDYHKDDIIHNLGVNAESEAPFTSSNVVINKYNKDNMTVYSAYGKFSLFDASGTFSGTYFVSDSKLAQIYITSSGGEDVKPDTLKIIDSFKLK